MFGILCFSKKEKSNIMWGYYASDHKGFLIEIDQRALNKITKDKNYIFSDNVDYNSKRAEYPSNINPKSIIDIIFRKDKEWKKEQEYRVLSKLSEDNYLKDDSNGIAIHTIFIESRLIKSIVIGAKADSDLRNKILDWKEQCSAPVEIKKAWLSKESFSLDYRKTVRVDESILKNII